MRTMHGEVFFMFLLSFKFAFYDVQSKCVKFAAWRDWCGEERCRTHPLGSSMALVSEMRALARA